LDSGQRGSDWSAAESSGYAVGKIGLCPHDLNPDGLNLRRTVHRNQSARRTSSFSRTSHGRFKTGRRKVRCALHDLKTSNQSAKTKRFLRTQTRTQKSVAAGMAAHRTVPRTGPMSGICGGRSFYSAPNYLASRTKLIVFYRSSECGDLI